MIAKINQLLEEVGALKAANAEELEVLLHANTSARKEPSMT